MAPIASSSRPLPTAAKAGWSFSFWSPAGPEQTERTLVYILAYPSRDAREASWKAFQDDPDWKAAKAASERDGKLVERVESVYLNPTDYSPMK